MKKATFYQIVGSLYQDEPELARILATQKYNPNTPRWRKKRIQPHPKTKKVYDYRTAKMSPGSGWERVAKKSKFGKRGRKQ